MQFPIKRSLNIFGLLLAVLFINNGQGMDLLFFVYLLYVVMATQWNI